MSSSTINFKLLQLTTFLTEFIVLQYCPILYYSTVLWLECKHGDVCTTSQWH